MNWFCVPKRWRGAWWLAGLVAVVVHLFTCTLAAALSPNSAAAILVPLLPSAACLILTFHSCHFSLLLCQSFMSLSHTCILPVLSYSLFCLWTQAAFALDLWWKKNNLNSNHSLSFYRLTHLLKTGTIDKRVSEVCVCMIELIVLVKSGPPICRNPFEG